MYEKVFRVVLNKNVKFLCVTERTQNYHCYRFFRYFIRNLCHRRTKYGHIRHQRLKINTKRWFVFCFTQIYILTVIFAIWTAILNWRNQRKTLVCNSKQCQELKYVKGQFEEYCSQFESVRVLQRKSLKKPLWSHTSRLKKIEKCPLKF